MEFRATFVRALEEVERERWTDRQEMGYPYLVFSHRPVLNLSLDPLTAFRGERSSMPDLSFLFYTVQAQSGMAFKGSVEHSV